MTKEEKWLAKRVGLITASELKDIISASGKVTEGIRAYIRRKRFERAHGFALPVSNKYMSIGNEQEPMAVAWLRRRFGNEIIYSKELDEIPFWIVDWGRFGASPDAFTEDEKHVYEIKVAASNGTIEFFADPHTSYSAKQLAMEKEYLPQILGQFLSNEKVEKITLVRYIPQLDDVIQDTDSPLADWRGYLFEYHREGLIEEIDEMKERILRIDGLINSDLSPEEMK